MRQEQKTTTRSPDETWQLASEILESLKPGDVLALHGDLGSGKTCFVQGLARAMGIERAVNSPTFTIVNEYGGGRMRLYHIDLYRLAGQDEALGLGLDEYIHGDGITVIEWAERVEKLLPEKTVHISFEAGSDPDERIITVRKPRG